MFFYFKQYLICKTWSAYSENWNIPSRGGKIQILRRLWSPSRNWKCFKHFSLSMTHTAVNETNLNWVRNWKRSVTLAASSWSQLWLINSLRMSVWESWQVKRECVNHTEQTVAHSRPCLWSQWATSLLIRDKRWRSLVDCAESSLSWGLLGYFLGKQPEGKPVMGQQQLRFRGLSMMMHLQSVLAASPALQTVLNMVTINHCLVKRPPPGLTLCLNSKKAMAKHVPSFCILVV